MNVKLLTAYYAFVPLQTKHGYLWTTHHPRVDLLDRWETSRAASRENVVSIDFRGTIQCDGYAGDGAIADRRPGTIALASCCAHVRRKFHDILEPTPRSGGWLLFQVSLPSGSAPAPTPGRPTITRCIWAQQGLPVLERIHKALVLLKASHRDLPQSLICQAIDYALGQWPTLEIYLGDGCVEIDNSLVYDARVISQVLLPPDLCRVPI